MDCKIIINLKQGKCKEKNYTESLQKSKDREKFYKATEGRGADYSQRINNKTDN